MGPQSAQLVPPRLDQRDHGGKFFPLPLARGLIVQFASWIWFFSLRQLQELNDIWLAQPASIQQAIQDEVRSLPAPRP